VVADQLFCWCSAVLSCGVRLLTYYSSVEGLVLVFSFSVVVRFSVNVEGAVCGAVCFVRRVVCFFPGV
jgi:hypothetical protein